MRTKDAKDAIGSCEIRHGVIPIESARWHAFHFVERCSAAGIVPRLLARLARWPPSLLDQCEAAHMLAVMEHADFSTLALNDWLRTRLQNDALFQGAIPDVLVDLVTAHGLGHLSHIATVKLPEKAVSSIDLADAEHYDDVFDAEGVEFVRCVCTAIMNDATEPQEHSPVHATDFMSGRRTVSAGSIAVIVSPTPNFFVPPANARDLTDPRRVVSSAVRDNEAVFVHRAMPSRYVVEVLGDARVVPGHGGPLARAILCAEIARIGKARPHVTRCTIES